MVFKRDRAAMHEVVVGADNLSDIAWAKAEAIRAADSARGHHCRFCGEFSTTATCDACADEAGW
jgi:recombinational DNA repair protein RecR